MKFQDCCPKIIEAVKDIGKSCKQFTKELFNEFKAKENWIFYRENTQNGQYIQDFVLPMIIGIFSWALNMGDVISDYFLTNTYINGEFYEEEVANQSHPAITAYWTNCSLTRYWVSILPTLPLLSARIA